MDDHKLFSTVKSINQEFYELVYDHPWLKQVFAVIEKEIIINQQTDFMVQSLGGPKKYGGRTPSDAHPHIFIDEDMWQLREELLIKSFDKLNIEPELRNKWLKIDNAFKNSIVKKSPDECQKRYKNDIIINIPKI